MEKRRQRRIVIKGKDRGWGNTRGEKSGEGYKRIGGVKKGRDERRGEMGR